MNAPRYWQLHSRKASIVYISTRVSVQSHDSTETLVLYILYSLYASSAVETSANSPRFSFPYGAMNFMAALGIRMLIANSCTRYG
jgi:hypothetical protein